MENNARVMVWHKTEASVDFVAEVDGIVHPDGTVHLIMTTDGLQTFANVVNYALQPSITVEQLTAPAIPEPEIVPAPPAVKTAKQRRRKSVNASIGPDSLDTPA